MGETTPGQETNEELVRAVRAIAFGDKSPGGLEALAMAIGGLGSSTNTDPSLAQAVAGGLSEVASALREGLAEVAEAVRGAE